MNKLKIVDLSFCDLETPQQTSVQGGITVSSSSVSTSSGTDSNYSSSSSIFQFSNGSLLEVSISGPFNSTTAVTTVEAPQSAIAYVAVSL